MAATSWLPSDDLIAQLLYRMQAGLWIGAITDDIPQADPGVNAARAPLTDYGAKCLKIAVDVR
jgi:hypothetical protein